ncbi:uncharacterized protein FOMMEDRAFT_95369, partial [Fomitiporia mediterranea MF3/22]|uniref:uncharacterized protein n=1 Tax=Fomitiporia mediterranea (strain MF3/22) TaxID=694068 RepID=UPI0004407A33
SWDTFKTGVIVYYLSLKTGAQYARSDLDAIVQKWAERGIMNRDNLGTYHQEFTLIATYLTTNNKLSLEESCHVFPYVFCRAITEKLIQKLEIKYLDHKDGLVYNIVQVVAVAGSILRGSTLTVVSGSDMLVSQPAIVDRKIEVDCVLDQGSSINIV